VTREGIDLEKATLAHDDEMRGARRVRPEVADDCVETYARSPTRVEQVAELRHREDFAVHRPVGGHFLLLEQLPELEQHVRIQC